MRIKRPRQMKRVEVMIIIVEAALEAHSTGRYQQTVKKQHSYYDQTEY